MKQFLLTLADRGIRLTIREGRLFVAAGASALTEADKASLRQYRQDIISLISQLEQPAVLPLCRAPAGQPPVLSYAQQRLWFIDQLQGGSAEYNIPLAFEITGPLDLAVTRSAFTQIVRRHQVLHTVYRLDAAGVPQPDLLTDWALELSQWDLRHCAPALLPHQLTTTLERESTRPFDLRTDLMLRVACLQLPDAADNTPRWVLLLNLHHIAADGWSMTVLFREFLQLYTTLRDGRQDELPALSLQYADYAWWHRQLVQDSRVATQTTYWQQQLAEAPAVHQLRLSHPRPAQKQFAGAMVSATLPAQTANRLLTLAKHVQLTPFMLLHAALALVLSRHSNSDDILLGSPVANRPDVALDGLIGFFVNTLVFRLDTNQPDLRSYLAHVRQVHLAAQQHQDLPFERLVELLQVPRSTAYSPLFQILLTTSNEFGPLQQTEQQLAGLQIKSLAETAISTKFDLDIHLTLTEHGVSSAWIYDVAIFSEADVVQLNTHLLNVLTGFAELTTVQLDAGVPLGSVPMLDPSELAQLKQWQGPTIPQQSQLGIHHWFEQQVRQQPDGIALIDGGQHVSFQQLAAQAEAIAAYLQHCCLVQPGQVIGLFTRRGTGMVAAILGILKAGAVYLPFDVKATDARLRHIVADARLTLVLADDSALPEAFATVRQVRLASIKPSQPLNPSYSGDLMAAAYLLYTSGSTGSPKGVCQTHQTLLNLVEHQYQSDGVTAALNTLQFTPITFDVSIQELATCWRTGSCLTLMTEQEKDQLDRLADLLAVRQIERLFMPPAVFELLAEQLQSASGQLPQLREIFVAGDVCRVTPEIANFMQRHPQCRIFNHYGPTETHVVSTYQLSPNDHGDCSIGRAVANTALLVLDGQQAPVASGDIGELYVAGPGLAIGYQNNTALTAAAFVVQPVPGLLSAATRMYKTGDLVRYRPDGALQFIGRADFQLKIRGFRIEPAEIECQLNQCPDVESSLVMAQKTADGSGQLVAYVKMQGATEQFDPVALQTQLAATLPAYMVPAAIVRLSQWPLTRNGKIDRQALPPVAELTTQQYKAPVNALQQQLQQIWALLLERPAEQIPVDVSFFALGGHSLLAVRLVAAIRQQLAAELSVRDVFTAATIEQLALLLPKACQEERCPAPASIGPTEGIVLPLSYAQQRLWLVDRLQGGSPQYNMPLAFHTKGSLDLEILQQVLSALIQRHQILRTRYPDHDSGPCQWVDAAAPLPLIQHDCSGFPLPQRQQMCEELLAAEAARPFDLAQEWPIRVSFYGLELQQADCSDRRFVEGILFINLHHIAMDGWSLSILQQELFALYQAMQQGLPSPLPALALQYADFAIWQRQEWPTAVLQGQQDYWRQQLADVPVMHGLALAQPRPAQKAYIGASECFRLPQSYQQKLQDLAAQHQLTPFMLMHAALALLLSRHSNSHDIVIGTPVANRLYAELEGLIGFFVNVLVLRLNTAQPLLSTYLAHVRQVHVAAQSNQDISFESLVELLQISRDEAFSPLCQIMLTYQHKTTDTERSAPALPGVTLQPLAGTATVAKFDLDVEFVADADGLTVNWIYDCAIFSAEQIRQLGRQLLHLLRALADLPDAAVAPAELPIFDDVELAQFSALAGSRQPYDSALCIHQLFEQQVALAPTHPALQCGDQVLSYQQLNQQANQIARYLQQQCQLVPDTLIGLCTERSVQMISGTLAILKAGAAYVPLDPTYPAERLEFMLQDSAVKIILADRTTVGQLDTERYQVICLDSIAEILQHYADEDLPAAGLTSAHLAYAIYTSGSTGLPKGVLLEHRGIINLALNQRRMFALNADSRVLHFASMSFDAGTWEYAMALLNGATLILADSAQRLSPLAINQLLEQAAITHVTLPPAFLALMTFQPDLALQSLIVAGEACDAELVNRWGGHYPFYNAYGPTETSVCATYTRLRPGERISIGKALDNLCLYVLDASQQLLPVGVIGELYIGGDGLARAYHQQPELTAARFIWQPQLQQRLYRTGDLVRWLPDGQLEFAGRTDSQVKLRGMRIELSEIETQLMQSELVDVAVVLLKTAPNGSQTLAAYIHLVAGVRREQDDFAVLVAQLQQQLLTQLPRHMVPPFFTEVLQWPLTPNGKIDKKALPEPDFTAGQPHYVAATTDTELALVQLWASLLQVPAAQLSVTADFFLSGGSSILITRLETAIRHQFAVEFPLRELFTVTTLTEQASHIEYLLLRNRAEPQHESLVDMAW